jgi:hypothetical protein
MFEVASGPKDTAVAESPPKRRSSIEIPVEALHKAIRAGPGMTVEVIAHRQSVAQDPKDSPMTVFSAVNGGAIKAPVTRNSQSSLGENARVGCQGCHNGQDPLRTETVDNAPRPGGSTLIGRAIEHFIPQDQSSIRIAAILAVKTVDGSKSLSANSRD